MKKNSTAIALILSAVLFSCTKESLQKNTATAIIPTVTSPAQVRIVSEWLTLPLTNSSYNGGSSLRAKHQLVSTVSYDYNDHVQLAFARSRGRESYVYRKLPINFSTSQGNVRLDFTLDYTSFTLNIWNTDFPAQQPSTNEFSNMQYRFIVIPKSMYQSLAIDWSDYTAIATALNL